MYSLFHVYFNFQDVCGLEVINTCRPIKYSRIMLSIIFVNIFPIELFKYGIVCLILLYHLVLLIVLKTIWISFGLTKK